MKVYTLTTYQWLAAPRPAVFAFFERPENLRRITPSALGFRILTPSPIPMGVGRLIDYRIRLLGLPVGWRTLISTYDPPRQFVDEQIRGPYAFWHHRHRFEVGEAGTRVIDEVRYAMPLAGLGRLVHGLWVRPYLRRVFEFRGQVIARLFAQGNAQGRDRGGVLIRFAEADLI
jgi:hypothetical protein